MKIVLVPNPTPDNGIPDVHLPLGLMSVATILRNSGFDVEILDINSVSSDHYYRDVPDAIMAKAPDVVGFSTMCNQYPTTIRIARHCREVKPDLQILFGGPQATITDTATIEMFPCVDIVVRGECESNITQIIKALPNREALREIPGITFRDGKQIIKTSPNPPIENLDALPFPDYDLFPSTKSLEMIPIEVGRGCPFECTFCCTNGFWQRTFRLRSVENIVRLTKKLVTRYGIKNFDFLHDILTLSRERVIQLCDALERENLKIQWFCSSRIDCLDAELLRRMASAGCAGILFGIESGSVRMQEIIQKRLEVGQAVGIARQMAERGIPFNASFITGFPEERVDDLEQTIRLMIALRSVGKGPEEFQLHLLAPLPGNVLNERYGKSLLFDGNFSDIAGAELIDDDLDLIKKYPDIFSVFYYYPTPFLEREMLLKIRYIVLNLLCLPYTAFIFWKDRNLRFPKSVIDQHSLLDLPKDHKPRIGESDDIMKVCHFLRNVVCRLGFEGHFVHDVMEYEVAANKVVRNDIVEPQIKEFTYDVEELLEAIRLNNFQRLPTVIRKVDHVLLFTKKGNKPVTVRLPKKIAQLCK